MISLVITTLNEEKSLQYLLDSIAQQILPPDEVVICDGGSRDATLDLLTTEAKKGRMNLRVLTKRGANISQGRNTAISSAKGDIIACTDAGVRLDKDWLHAITLPLRAENRQTMAVGGFFLPDPHNAFEVSMSAAVLPELREINPVNFLPSSRSVAFLKSAWERVGGYPEWLDYCEDLIFDFNLRECCGGFTFAPTAIVHFRPRGSIRSFFKQYYLYARGDGKANLWFKRHVIRYFTYLLLLPALLVAGGAGYWVCWLILGLGMVVYLGAPIRRLRNLSMWATLPTAQKYVALLWVPIIKTVGDVAKMIGYPVGVVWRLSGQGRRPLD